jgi:photosystem II stability/assembly factor-like uncharacterized protein
MRRDPTFRRLDPVDSTKVAHVSSSRVFDDLRREIMRDTEAVTGTSDTDAGPPRLRNQSGHRRTSIAFAVAAAILLVVGLTVFGPGAGGRKGATTTLPKGAITTPWHAARPLSVALKGGAVHQRSGTWTLVDDVLSGRWQQSLVGPPGGYLACPSASTCYVMSGHYASADANAPLLSVSLYVSTDVGSTWSVLPMPQGFHPTSPLACAGIADCAAGGTYNAKPVFVSTSDGGHSFVITPLPAGDGTLTSLSCASSRFCAGLATTHAGSVQTPSQTPSDATFLSTSDGGSTFVDAPIVAGDSMQALSCSSRLECTAVGTSDALGPNDVTAGVVARTEDGGRTWVEGTFPSGFGLSYLSGLSCADALHCSVTGNIAITVANSPQCASLPQVGASPTTTTTPTAAPSPAVQSISQFESQVATNEILKDAQSGSSGFSCNSGGQTVISDIASSSNGGLTWTPDPLPADVPQPQLFGLSCPTDDECWAAGSDAVPQQIGNVHNGGSSVMLGTTDGGSTWSKVTFNVPTDAPNDYGQSYLSIGLIACPSANVCLAQGSTAQSSPSAPLYSLVVPAST